MIKVNAMSQAKMIRMLLDGEYSCQDLAQETGLHYVTVQAYMRALHKEGAAYIARFEKDSRGRDAIKVYTLGDGVDAKRQKMTSAQRQAKCRQNQKIRELFSRGARRAVA